MALDLQTFDTILFGFVYSTIPGGAGGLATYLYGIKFGHYKNNKFLRKLMLELFGAMITASFISFLIKSKMALPITAFCVGTAWASIIHLIRKKITVMVESIIGNK